MVDLVAFPTHAAIASCRVRRVGGRLALQREHDRLRAPGLDAHGRLLVLEPVEALDQLQLTGRGGDLHGSASEHGEIGAAQHERAAGCAQRDGWTNSA